MKPKSVVGLQIVMGIVCVYHIVFGAALNLSDGFVDSAAKMYGAGMTDWSPQFLYILRPLGVFMLALGVLAAPAALHPSRHRITIYVFAGIFIVRAFQRLAFGEEISEIFAIGGSRNVTNMFFFFALAGVLIILDQATRRVRSPSQPATA